MFTDYTITGCSDCPMCNYSEGLSYACNHPDHVESILFIDTDDMGDPITPNTCPLFKYPIIIKTQSWQQFEHYWCREN